MTLAIEMDLPVVATNNVRFLKTENFDAHEVEFVLIRDGLLMISRRPKDYTDQQFLRSS